MAELSLQAQIPHNHCFGCGPDNAAGLNLESFWTGEGASVARFVPQQHHCAAPSHFVNGGIIATLIDCHSICSATALAYARAGRPLGSAPHIYLVTAALSVRYLRPAPLAATLQLFADSKPAGSREFAVRCTLEARGRTCAIGEVVAAQVGEAWMKEEREAQAPSG